MDPVAAFPAIALTSALLRLPLLARSVCRGLKAPFLQLRLQWLLLAVRSMPMHSCPSSDTGDLKDAGTWEQLLLR